MFLLNLPFEVLSSSHRYSSRTKEGKIWKGSRASSNKFQVIVFMGYVKDANPHPVANNQLCTDCFYITSSANQESDVISPDLKGWGSKRSLGTISLNSSCWSCLGGSVLISSNPPVSLLIGGLSVARCWVVTIGRLSTKRWTSLFPIMDARFKVKVATSLEKEN